MVMRERLLVGAALLSLFVTVALLTTGVLFLVNDGPPPMQVVKVCVPEHDVMPEDLGHPDREAQALGCRRG